MSIPLAQPVSRTQCLLGEGPLWDAARGRLWWLDILGRRLHGFDPATDLRTEAALTAPLTSLALDADGELVGWTAGGFGRLTTDGAFTLLHPFADEPAGNRTNDGKVDGDGRYWIGTMDDSERQDSGAVWALGADGPPQRHASGFRVPNGPAFDAHGRMFLADSARGLLYRFDGGRPHDAREGQVIARFAGDDGAPDGMTCDAQGHVWIAFWDGWCLRRLSPDGVTVATVPMPVARPTSCTFGGEGLATLFVTSARVGLEAAALAGQPLAGALFALRPKVAGVTMAAHRRGAACVSAPGAP